jgi:hypothetical protein
MAEHALTLGYVRLLLLLSAHPVRHAWKKAKEWKRTPSTQYGDIRRQYSNYTEIILIVINTITLSFLWGRYSSVFAVFL